MTAMFSDNVKMILTHMQANQNIEETAQMIAEATGLPVKTVNGCVTAGLQRKGLAERVVVEGMDGKVIRLTDAGMTADPDAEKPE